MAQAKAKKMLSPVGKSGYCHVNTPDSYKDPDTGVESAPAYKVDLIVDGAAAAKMVAFLDKKAAQGMKLYKGKKKIYPTIPYTENDDGTVTFKFKTLAGGTYKTGPKAGQTWERRPVPVFDTDMMPVDEEGRKFWSGSTIQVWFTVSEYATPLMAGATIYLEGVKLLEGVYGGGVNASEFEDAEDFSDGEYEQSESAESDDDNDSFDF